MPPKPPHIKNNTTPGLGIANMPRMDSAEMKRVRDSFREDLEAKPSEGSTPAPGEAAPPGKRLRDSIRREDPDEPDTNDRPTSENVRERVETTSDRPAVKKPVFDEEPATATRRREHNRPAVTVDQVGPTAMKLARTTSRQSAPKPTGSRAMVSKAPIDTRAAFVLSLVDGRNTMDAIVDMSGMVEAEVKPILERLARLGLISLP